MPSSTVDTEPLTFVTERVSGALQLSVYCCAVAVAPPVEPTELPTRWSPQEVEAALYQRWLDAGYFTANPASGRPPFRIVIPPRGMVIVELDMLGAVDLAAERTRLAKDLAIAEKVLAACDAKLNNTVFAHKAPADVVAKTQARREAAVAEIARVTTRLEARPNQ